MINKTAHHIKLGNGRRGDQVSITEDQTQGTSLYFFEWGNEQVHVVWRGACRCQADVRVSSTRLPGTRG